MKEIRYTYIDFIALRTLDLSINEYIICDIVHKLQTKAGYCYASNEYFAKCLNLTERGVINIIKKLIDKGILLVVERTKGQTKKMIVSDRWQDAVIFSSENISHGYEKSSEGGEKTSLGGEKSSYNNNIYNNSNNNINNINTNTISSDKPRASKPKEKAILKNPYSEVSSLLVYFYDKLVPAEKSARRFIKTNQEAMDMLITTYSRDDIRATIDVAESNLRTGQYPKVINPVQFLNHYKELESQKRSSQQKRIRI